MTDIATDKAYPTLSLQERDRRWAAVRGLLKEHEIEGIVVFGTGRDNADSYLTNEARRTIVLLSQDEDPTMFTGDVPLDRLDAQGSRWERWAEDWRHGDGLANLAAVLRERGLDRSRLGVVGLTGRFVGESAGTISYKTWSRAMELLPDVRWVDTAAAYESLVIIKSPEEQVLLRKAAALGERACQAFVDTARAGGNEHEIAPAAFHAVIAGGGWVRWPFMLERAGASMFAWSVPEWFEMGGAPHVPRKGDTIAAEIFAFYGGQESQQQIDVSIGEPSPLLRELEEVCLESYQAGLDALTPGLRFSELAAIMEEPLQRSRTWNTGPMVQTVSPIYNGATRINPGVDPALKHLEKLPTGHPLDGDFVIREGHAFAFEPNALRDGQRVCVGGTVLLTSNGPEELNSVPNRLNVVWRRRRVAPDQGTSDEGTPMDWPLSRAFNAGVIALGGTLALASCNMQAPNAGKGGTSQIVIGTSNIAETLDPLQASDAHNDFNLAPMYDRLVNYDANGKLVPQLATSWKFDADATHLTLRLRDGTNFHSGNPFTARDVVYTLDRAKKIGSGVAAFLTNYVSAEAVDQHHVRITLKEHDLTFIGALSRFYIVDSTLVEKHEGTDNGQGWLATHEAGSGPFAMAQYSANQEIQLKRYSDYWAFDKERPEAAVLRMQENRSGSRDELLAGDIDLTVGLSGADVEQVRKNGHFKLMRLPVPRETYGWMNMKGASPPTPRSAKPSSSPTTTKDT